MPRVGKIMDRKAAASRRRDEAAVVLGAAIMECRAAKISDDTIIGMVGVALGKVLHEAPKKKEPRCDEQDQ